MGITRQSLYATLGNKESLLLKAVDCYQRTHMAYAHKALKHRRFGRRSRNYSRNP
ncbi:hypothetical protein [Paraburkholderia largidicola]|uniref:hypothetical protein n=1 Tax=Paraburkholderia largidicola TaxID=3014751 RepID=UPI001FB18D21|nr:hypothetical protein [Paraburkholderia sp. PGU16]